MTEYLYTIRHAGFPHLRLSFSVAADPNIIQKSDAFADNRTIFQLLQESVKKSREIGDTLDLISFASKERLSPEDITIHSIEIDADPLTLGEYTIKFEDGPMKVMAPDYARASLLAAFKRHFQGNPFENLTGDIQDNLRSLAGMRNEDNQWNFNEPLLIRREMVDWNLLDGDPDDVLPEHQEPIVVEVTYSSGVMHTFFKDARGNDLNSVSFEYEAGRVSAHHYVPTHDEMRTTVKSDRETMSVDLINPDEFLSYSVDKDDILLTDSSKMQSQRHYQATIRNG